MAGYEEYVTPNPAPARAGTFVNVAGAAVSLALIAGVGVWGYKLVVRDVSGIPVVRAMEGTMRVAPEAPGGDVALHAGLSVNQVAAQGEAADPGDVLLLAPATAQLSEEDLIAQPLAEAGEVVAVDRLAGDRLGADRLAGASLEQPVALEVQPETPSGPMTTDDILAFADQIASGSTPLTELAAGETIAPKVTLNGTEVVAAFVPEISPSVPGVAVSLRPTVRPAGLIQAVAAAAALPETVVDAVVEASAPAVSESAALLTASVPAGTTLVQLGAFPTAVQAATEWSRLSGRFDQYLSTKNQVIQEATSGGQTFYRLRASGFDNTGDARRFCAALVAGNADCIPVVAR
jgi:hypothetical protein